MTTTTTYRVVQTDTVTGRRWAYDTFTGVWVPDGSALEQPFDAFAPALAFHRAARRTPRMTTDLIQVERGRAFVMASDL